jgi:hypothetical protein
MGLAGELPDFDCAELQDFDPGELVSEDPDDFDRLMLALALAFNDLKGLLVVSWWMKPHRPKDPYTPTPYGGQWAGMALQLNRLVASVAHEVVKLLREHREVIDSDEFQVLVKALPTDADPRRDSRRRWEQIMALVDEKKTGLSHALELIRHTSTFHYYQPKKLMQCYLEHFDGGPGNPPARRRGYVSLGQSMERTRFYYADGAAEAVMGWAAEEGGVEKWNDALEEVVRALNFAIGPLLGEHLRRRLGLLRENGDRPERDSGGGRATPRRRRGRRRGRRRKKG